MDQTSPASLGLLVYALLTSSPLCPVENYSMLILKHSHVVQFSSVLCTFFSKRYASNKPPKLAWCISRLIGCPERNSHHFPSRIWWVLRSSWAPSSAWHVDLHDLRCRRKSSRLYLLTILLLVRSVSTSFDHVTEGMTLTPRRCIGTRTQPTLLPSL